MPAPSDPSRRPRRPVMRPAATGESQGVGEWSASRGLETILNSFRNLSDPPGESDAAHGGDHGRNRSAPTAPSPQPADEGDTPMNRDQRKRRPVLEGLEWRLSPSGMGPSPDQHDTGHRGDNGRNDNDGRGNDGQNNDRGDNGGGGHGGGGKGGLGGEPSRRGGPRP